MKIRPPGQKSTGHRGQGECPKSRNMILTEEYDIPLHAEAFATGLVVELHRCPEPGCAAVVEVMIPAEKAIFPR